MSGPVALALLGMLLVPVASSASGAPAPTGDTSAEAGGVVELDESGLTPEQGDEVLPDDWREVDDEAHVVLNDADGITVLGARASDGYAWETVATVPVPWADTDLWVANSCVTSSGDRMAVVYAPRAATNDESAFSAGARAAIVDLRSGEVAELGSGYTIAYYNPGCGEDDTVTITRLEPDEGVTRVAVVDAQTAEITTKVDLEGQVTSAIAREDGTVLAARGADLVAVAPGATAPEVVVADTGAAYDLTLDGSGRLAYVARDGEGADTSTAYVTTLDDDTPAQAIGTGPVTQTGVAPAGEEGFYLTGKDVEPTPGLDGVELLPEASPGSVISSSGELVVDAVTSTGLADVPEIKKPAATAVVPVAEAEIAATVVDSGTTLTYAMDEPAPAAPLEARATGTARPSGFAARQEATASASVTSTGGAGDPSSPIEAERYCAVPRNDPANQAYQPKPRQVEWAVDRAVKGQLTQTRPANWRNLGMSSYSPQGMFPAPQLTGGGTIPPQIVLGVLAQESNLWQASRFTAPGNTGNPLIGDYYGTDDTWSIWQIDYTEADCGYGVGQITDGMRLAGHERTDDSGRKIETALPYAQQRAIALDYTANVAKSVQMLSQKWNQLAAAGMLVNGGDPKYIENWFLTTWAYNTGFYPYVNDSTPWGVGWFNNPVNPNYDPRRTPFLRSQGDAAKPQQWPYPEKVIGWAAYGTSFVETQWADPAKREYPQRLVSSYTTAWWNDPTYRDMAQPKVDTFCKPDVNDCDPSLAQPCKLGSYKCWWHGPVRWKSSCDLYCGQGFERFPASYATEASAMASTLPAKTLESSFLPNCSYPPTGVVVVDNTTHPTARNSNECTRRATVGSFSLSFGSPDSDGRYPSKVDFHQQGGGFNGHFWFAHMQHRVKTQRHITGTWDRGANLNGKWTRVWVHLPDYAGWTQQAGYTIDLGNGTTQKRYLPQRRYKNEWVSLGVFEMKGSPKVSLSNVLVDESTTGRVWYDGAHQDIEGYDNVAWDAVGFQVLPGKPDDFVVSLGDSYASGEGAGDYVPWSDNNGTNPRARNACHQSVNAWIRRTTLPGDAEPLGARADAADTGLDLQLLACSGAQTEDLLPYYHIDTPQAPENAERQTGRYGQYGTVSQLDAGYLDTNTTLVTLSIGGNDMQFGPILAACIKANFAGTPEDRSLADCSRTVLEDDTLPAQAASKERVDTKIADSLITLVQLVRDRAPNARIAIFGYPKLFETTTSCVLINEVNQVWLNELADGLNAKIAETAAILETYDEPGSPEIFFVDTQAYFTGKNLCTGADSGLTGLQFGVTPGEDPQFPRPWPRIVVDNDVASQTSVHPNTNGTGFYAQALEDALADLP
ncbi:GDSL-type esterase/lipase family protein [Cellulomonas flavigena]|uniref:GDSL-type esterase/lipase family protein n=1 Tax=Cellulomonas flavigena TaxID=1711 RepID=UPI0011D1DE73|nr:GDSL-type esterase/lipase family protein [Cellulomonas flavigena]